MQHSQETDIHARGGNRTRNPTKTAVVDARFRRRCQWGRLEKYKATIKKDKM